MNKLLFFIPLVFCLTFGLIGCSSDKDEDVIDPPICEAYQDPVEIKLVDESGNNLITWNSIENAALKNVKVIYANNEYPLTDALLLKPQDSQSSKESSETIFSLKNTREDLDNIVLSFGSFITFEKFTQEFDLKWSNGTIDKIKMVETSKEDPQNSGSYILERELYLNGELCEGSIVKILKDRL